MAPEKSATTDATPASKIGIGSAVIFWSLRSGGQPEKCAAMITATHKPAAGSKEDQMHVDLDFQFKLQGKTVERAAFVVRRGRGPQDAPCWCPVPETARA